VVRDLPEVIMADCKGVLGGGIPAMDSQILPVCRRARIRQETGKGTVQRAVLSVDFSVCASLYREQGGFFATGLFKRANQAMVKTVVGNY
jgi:hypothetical protein